MDANSLEDIVGFHHRKEEISDIKFSPGQHTALVTKKFPAVLEGSVQTLAGGSGAIVWRSRCRVGWYW